MNPSNLRPGIYRIHWVGGGTSIASVGVTKKGTRWIAATNWVRPTSNKKVWEIVKDVELEIPGQTYLDFNIKNSGKKHWRLNEDE